ncbi:MAG: histidinol-phosphatase [Rubripirellula sp.]
MTNPSNQAPLLFESHSHTPLCNHAIGQPTEYAAVAQQRGLRGLIVTCHNPMPDGFSSRVRMREDELPQYLDLVAQTRQEWEDRIDVRLGLEADYFEGHESYLEKQLASQDFHFVLGSVHPQIDEFRQKYWSDNPIEVQRTYFRLLVKAAKSGLFDSLAHPDLIKNLFSDSWNPDVVIDDIRRSLDEIAKTGIAMELNTSGINKTVQQMNPFPDMLREMQVRGIPVTLGADAHQPHRVADGYETALELLADCGYNHVNFFLDRSPQQVRISDALASLPQPAAIS